MLTERFRDQHKQLRKLATQSAELLHRVPMASSAAEFFTEDHYFLMERVAKKALWLGVLMIHQEHQGHAASTASAMHIMTTIYFSRAHDFLSFSGGGRTAELIHQCESQKPHAVPGWDALLYLEGILTKEQIQAFRTFKGPNAYPTHEDPGI